MLLCFLESTSICGGPFKLQLEYLLIAYLVAACTVPLPNYPHDFFKTFLFVRKIFEQYPIGFERCVGSNNALHNASLITTVFLSLSFRKAQVSAATS